MKGRVDMVVVEPILRVEPSQTAGENEILIQFLHYVGGRHTYASKTSGQWISYKHLL